eukprot:GHVN01023201.1.p1 GENE.GHVN01023201.1~~GHVN01023201.1.p1  ORF type:complete len:634 (+),score=115.34 GHVN01023201.1:1224-3125(+)
MSHYASLLRAPSIVGLTVLLIAFLRTGGQSGEGHDFFVSGVWLGYSLYIIFWSLYFNVSWGRKEERLRIEWGCDAPCRPVLRPEYRFDRLIHNPANPAGLPVMHYSPCKKRLRHACTLTMSGLYFTSLLLTLMGLVAIQSVVQRLQTIKIIVRTIADDPVSLANNVMEYIDWTLPIRIGLAYMGLDVGVMKMVREGMVSEVNEELEETWRLYGFASSLIAATVAYIADKIWQFVALMLCRFENHQWESSFNDSLSLKYFTFSILNYFVFLAFDVFFKPMALMQCGPRTTGGCVGSMSLSVVAMASVYFFFNSIFEIAKGLLTMIRTRWRRGRRDTRFMDEQGLTTAIEEQYDLVSGNTTSSVFRWTAASLQFWFMVQFAASFPPMGVLSLVFALFKLRVEAVKLNNYSQRPFPAPCTGMGIHKYLLQLAQPVGVALNTGIIVFCYPFFDLLKTGLKWFMFMLIEHLLLMLLGLLWLRSPSDTLNEFRKARERQNAVLYEAEHGKAHRCVDAQRLSELNVGNDALLSDEWLEKESEMSPLCLNELNERNGGGDVGGQLSEGGKDSKRNNSERADEFEDSRGEGEVSGGRRGQREVSGGRRGEGKVRGAFGREGEGASDEGVVRPIAAISSKKNK